MKSYLATVLLTLLPLAGVWAAAAHNHIVVILDGSGSMGGAMPGTNNQTKMTFAKQAVTTVMQQIPDDYRVGLLVFGGGAPRDGWSYPLEQFNKKQFANAIRPIKPDGRTPLGAFLKTGADALLAARSKQAGYGTYRLLVLTDGEASDQKLVDRYLPDIVRKGLIVDVIGVDMRQDLALKRDVHRYRRANDARALQTALQEAFAEIKSDGAQGQGSTEDFEIIAPLPDESARGALEALANPGNDPISTAKPLPQPTAPTDAAPAAKPSLATPEPQAQNTTADDGMPTPFMIIAVMVAIGIFMKFIRR